MAHIGEAEGLSGGAASHLPRAARGFTYCARPTPSMLDSSPNAFCAASGRSRSQRDAECKSFLMIDQIMSLGVMAFAIGASMLSL